MPTGFSTNTRVPSSNVASTRASICGDEAIGPGCQYLTRALRFESVGRIHASLPRRCPSSPRAPPRSARHGPVVDPNVPGPSSARAEDMVLRIDDVESLQDSGHPLG